jgi:uncharacterized protein involved in type VI secretion and phage assembly
VSSNGTRFYGKFRGVVTDNQDPLMTGRVRARVTDVLGSDESGWAMPAAPFGGDQTGFFALPKVGAGVWIEFEQGNPDYPIWTGGFWGIAAEVPVLALGPAIPGDPNIVLQTTAQNTILVTDVPGPTGGIMLKSTTGATLIVNDTGIYIQNGKGASIIMTGPTVNINAGALTVV